MKNDATEWSKEKGEQIVMIDDFDIGTFYYLNGQEIEMTEAYDWLKNEGYPE